MTIDVAQLVENEIDIIFAFLKKKPCKASLQIPNQPISVSNMSAHLEPYWLSIYRRMKTSKTFQLKHVTTQLVWCNW